MTGEGVESEGLLWHQALAYAIAGRRVAELGRQAVPDVAFLTGWLRAQVPDGPTGTSYAVPADLMAGLGPAQFWAVLSRLRTELGPAGSVSPRRVLANRPLTADERRLLVEVPPHHGS